jgi:hypothetical protein
MMNELLENLPKPEITLVGEDGNAYSIMAIAQKGMRKAGWTKEQIDAYLEEAMSGDYDNLLVTTMKYCDVS